MKSLLPFFQVLLDELGQLCGISTNRDYETVTARYEHEGLSFLTIVLPTLEEGLLKSLSLGYSAPAHYPGFQVRGRLPVFLRGFFELVFDATSGEVLSNPSTDAIYAIRQACLVFKKIKLPCSPRRVEKAFRSFVECEQIVKETDSRAPFLDEGYDRLCVRVLSDLLSYMENCLSKDDFHPRHGGGSVAERLSSNGKYSQKEYSERLEQEFPASQWMLPNFGFYTENMFRYLEPGAERPSRVVQVPKTLKTPRIIAIEPSYMQFVQQGLLRLFVDGVRGDDNLRQSINGPSQIPNQLMARKGSIDGSYATLDLSEASDRVSNQHVRHLTRRFPLVQRALDASRSRKADVPGHGVLRLAKFASMGSAVTFPVEAIVFLTVVLYGIELQHTKPLTRGQLSRLMRGQVRVFGDDIVVPGQYAESVTQTLEHFGFKVNTRKSFSTGRFRESCGKEYYLGDDVSVVKVTTVLPTRPNHASEIESLSATRNLFFDAGLWRVCRWIDEHLEGLIPYPAVLSTSQIVGRYSSLGYESTGWDDALQRPLVRGAYVHRVKPEDELSDYGALLKYFITSEEAQDLPVLEEGHLKRAGRPDQARIKIRVLPPY